MAVEVQFFIVITYTESSVFCELVGPPYYPYPRGYCKTQQGYNLATGCDAIATHFPTDIALFNTVVWLASVTKNSRCEFVFALIEWNIKRIYPYNTVKYPHSKQQHYRLLFLIISALIYTWYT